MENNLSQNNSNSSLLNNTNDPQNNSSNLSPVSSPLQSTNSTNLLDTPNNIILTPTVSASSSVVPINNKKVQAHSFHFNWLYVSLVIILLILAIVIFYKNKKNVEITSYDN